MRAIESDPHWSGDETKVLCSKSDHWEKYSAMLWSAMLNTYFTLLTKYTVLSAMFKFTFKLQNLCQLCTVQVQTSSLSSHGTAGSQ